MTDTPKNPNQKPKRSLEDRSPQDIQLQVGAKKTKGHLDSTPVKMTDLNGQGEQGEIIPAWGLQILTTLKNLDKLDNIVETLDKLDKFNESHKAMTESMNATSDQVTKMAESVTKNEHDLFKIQTRCNDLERQCRYNEMEMARLKKEVIWQEATIKKTNLLFAGISEDEDAKLGGVLGAVHKVLVDNMGIDLDNVNIVECYRLGAPRQKSTTFKGKP
jgi:hypothetical protein